MNGRLNASGYEEEAQLDAGPRRDAAVAPPGGGSMLGLLLRVNARQVWRRIKSLRQQSRLLTALILMFVVGYVVLSFWLFEKGLSFVSRFPGLGSMLTERLLFLLFAFLFVLLLFSNLIISYTNLFRNRETSFLMSLPIPPEVIFRWKFMESTLLASWAFVFLIAPLLAAYGLTQQVAWHFYVMTPLLVGLFIVLPAVGGTWMAVTLARFMDRRTFQITALGLAVLLLAGAGFWLRPEAVSDRMLETRVLAVLDRLLAKTQFADFPLLPSYWLSAGVLYWSEGALRTAVFFILVLLSYVLFFGYLTFTRIGGFFYEAASTVQSRASVFGQWKWFQTWRQWKRRRAWAPGWLDQLVRALIWVRPDVKALIVKDIRMFWRDTTQWGQTIVLFGLLGVYIINLRHFSQQLTNPFWVNLVSYLNLGACALNLATLTTRFVYPQFSLEGKRIWIIGLAPMGLRRVVLAKYGLAGCASLIITLGLVVMSCHMLQLSWDRTLYFGMAVTVMTFCLTGLAIGLGVLYPNFKEENPSKIVSGFGGTFCLVLSFLYIVASVVLLALGSPWSLTGNQNLLLMFLCWTGFAVFSAVIGWLPLKFGLRRVDVFEL